MSNNDQDIKQGLKDASNRADETKNINSDRRLKNLFNSINLYSIDNWLVAVKTVLNTFMSIVFIFALIYLICCYQIKPLYNLLDEIQKYVLGINIYDHFRGMNNPNFTVNTQNLKALIILLTVRLTILSGSITLLLFLMRRKKKD
ncbi:hypothetical protein [Francisella philomiragia]|uniref:Uncharacterized protein n=1 Tax=Francisella philomiragia TaxID=28110 RepID=A0ABS1GD64_9GAMM|nr:hypothetical protein [Francisella philomiragia]MBK2259177.1 hypothetical protein [Francisella philomiragia]MBK2302786.1 hypothetical protein [Francisella philomiragia]